MAICVISAVQMCGYFEIISVSFNSFRFFASFSQTELSSYDSSLVTSCHPTLCCRLLKVMKQLFDRKLLKNDCSPFYQLCLLPSETSAVRYKFLYLHVMYLRTLNFTFWYLELRLILLVSFNLCNLYN